MPISSHSYSIQLNLRALSKLFSNTTASYKFLFFLSLLDIINSDKNLDKNKDIEPIPFHDIVTGMLYRAWYPHSQHRLSFGQSDQVVNVLNAFEEEQDGSINLRNAKNTIGEFLKRNPRHVQNLMRFVPYRLLRPFGGMNLGGLEGAALHLVIQEESAQYLTEQSEKAYPYAPNADTRSIALNPYWYLYFKEHYTILQSWASWEWARYMQKKNPAVPAIPAKLHPLLKRPSIDSDIRENWRAFMENGRLSCIFSNEKITPQNYELDHFLPWSFVAHNEVWNLLPITEAMNQAKSDKIPDMDSCLESFVDCQHEFLSFLKSSRTENVFQRATEPYLSALGIKNDAELCSRGVLLDAYGSYMEPLAGIALNQGFDSFEEACATK